MAPPLLETVGISKRYGAVRALKAVSVAVEAGEVIGLIGANGAGKSTLMKVLAGVVKPDSGELLVDGEPVAFRTPHDALTAGVVIDPQELNLIAEQSVAENLLLGELPTGLPWIVNSRSSRARARKLLSLVGLDAVDPAASAGSLGPVQARLVSIARALAKEPRVLILDEPSAALPTETARSLEPIVQRIAASGAAVIYVSHRFGEVERLCQRVIAMCDGQVAGELGPAEIAPGTMIHLVGGRAAEREPEPMAANRNADRRTVVRARGLSGARVQGIDLEVHRGEIVGIGGLHGSGRSELLRLLGGGQPTSGGEVEVLDGPQVRSPSEAARRGVGFIAEGRGKMIFPALSVTTNSTISILRDINRVLLKPRRESRLAGEVFERLNLVGGKEQPMAALSGGNQQKVCLSRWMLRNVPLLLLDEPTVGIDVGARAEIHRLLRELAASGTTILVASAEPEELVILCSRVIVLVEGEINAELSAPFESDNIVAASYAGYV
ncbi:MAG: sugar ABC transporter ATP-binding protein [Solirubrobacterales bacterium]